MSRLNGYWIERLDSPDIASIHRDPRGKPDHMERGDEPRPAGDGAQRIPHSVGHRPPWWSASISRSAMRRECWPWSGHSVTAQRSRRYEFPTHELLTFHFASRPFKSYQGRGRRAAFAVGREAVPHGARAVPHAR